jgi:type IV pilus assembly protein PilY1
MDPSNWTYDITTYANVATLPITARIATEQCFNTWYLYAGTGRYFTPQDNYGFTPSGGSSQTPNYLMGIPFTCDQYNNNCTSIASLNSPNSIAAACSSPDAQTIASTLTQGWEYPLNTASGSYLSERLITDPTISSGNQMFFTSAQPTSDPCGYGGQSRVWGLNCATGGALTQGCGSAYTVTNFNGMMYLQTSTGAIYNITDANSFNGSGTGGRTTQWYVGMPPETSPPIVQPTIPLNQAGRLIQWIEK